MKMYVYIAGGWKDQETIIKPMMARVRALGIEISHDWTTQEGQLDVGGDDQLTDGQQREFALDDLRGVRLADVVWFMQPTYKGSRGSYVELGYALALRMVDGQEPSVLVSGEGHRNSIFTSLADARYDSHEEALTWLKLEAGIV